MAITSFEIKNQKALFLAKCDDVPMIMIIAGPNGVGKSTLLHSLKIKAGKVEGTGTFRYIPPHRDWHRTDLVRRAIYGERLTYANVLSSDQIPGIPDVRINDANRSPISSDESTKLIKYSLSQLEEQRGMAIKARVDKDLENSEMAKIENIFKPLIDFTRYLLPHIEFSRILIGPSRIDCFWKRARGFKLEQDDFDEIEIDALSSGEKSLLILFFPFIENQIEENIKKLAGESESEKKLELVVLIDEPELHLHPILQSSILEFIRNKVSENVQFIIATQSPTILDNATASELFILTPRKDPEEEDQNQLVKVTTDDEKLEALRTLCGDTYTFTICRSIICIEGQTPQDRASKTTDKRILEILCPEISLNMILPLGSKNVVLDTAKRLRETLPEQIPNIKIFSLTDSDREETEDGEWNYKLPVCSIENILLDPECIMELLKNYLEKSKLKSVEEVKKALEEITSNLEEDEIRIRIEEKIGPIKGSISGTSVESINESKKRIFDKVNELLPDDNAISKILEDASTEVKEIVTNNEQLKKFRGKKILKKFFDEFIQPLGFGYHIFLIELAKIISKKEDFINELCEIIKKINKKQMKPKNKEH